MGIIESACIRLERLSKRLKGCGQPAEIPGNKKPILTKKETSPQIKTSK